MNMIKNNAGGNAFALSGEHALAQFIATGFLGREVNFAQKPSHDTLLNLCKAVSPEFVAQTAIYARKAAYMKDSPAFICAYLASIGRNDLLTKVWDTVMDSPKLVRNFVQFIRSGVMGRKSLGSRPKKLVQRWLNSKTPIELFRNSIGDSPSMADLLKMVHPKPGTKEQEVMYRYLLGLDVDSALLPKEVQEYELMKKSDGKSTDLPKVPFEMLTSQKLSDQQWKCLAEQASWTQIRMNLNTFARHNVFQDKATVSKLAAKLSDRNAVLKTRVFPYQLYNTYRHTTGLPTELSDALRQSVFHSLENIPSMDDLKIKVMIDVSGSMKWKINSDINSKSDIRFIDVAALFAAALLVKNNNVEVIPFDTRVHPVNMEVLSKLDLFGMADSLARMGGGGTSLSCAMEYLVQSGDDVQLVVYLSDNESWRDRQFDGITGTQYWWNKLKERNPGAKMVCLDIAPNSTSQARDDASILNVGGFSDQVFDIIAAFTQSDGENHWVDLIKKIEV